MSVAFPLSPAVQIQEVIQAVNQLHESSPLNTAVILVNTSTYTYAPSVVQDGLLAVNTSSQKLIEIPPDLPNNSRVTIFDKTGTAGLHAIVLRPINGATIDGSSDDLVINVNHGAITLLKLSDGIFSVGRDVVNSSWMDAVVYFNQSIDENLTITDEFNALSVGPISVSLGVTVTVNEGARWAVV